MNYKTDIFLEKYISRKRFLKSWSDALFHETDPYKNETDPKHCCKVHNTIYDRIKVFVEPVKLIDY